jgi:hypothetical protein
MIRHKEPRALLPGVLQQGEARGDIRASFPLLSEIAPHLPEEERHPGRPTLISDVTRSCQVHRFSLRAVLSSRNNPLDPGQVQLHGSHERLALQEPDLRRDLPELADPERRRLILDRGSNPDVLRDNRGRERVQIALEESQGASKPFRQDLIDYWSTSSMTRNTRRMDESSTDLWKRSLMEFMSTDLGSSQRDG